MRLDSLAVLVGGVLGLPLSHRVTLFRTRLYYPYPSALLFL